MKGVRVLLAVVLLVLVGMFIFNYTSTGNVFSLIDPDPKCDGVDGVGGGILILENSREFEGLKDESEDMVEEWRLQGIEECERQQNLVIEKCGDVFGACRTAGNTCKPVNDRITYNCLDYLPEYQECEIVSETEFRSTWRCTISRVEISLGTCTCRQ